MSLEPQDRTGRATADKLIDTTSRMEFTSRIFVPLEKGAVMRSFPKLRKTFAAATVTFNVTDDFPKAAATKMLSIMGICDQCPLQFAFYARIYRYHKQRLTDDRLVTVKRKYEWWELKLIHMVNDNNLESTLSAVYEHLKSKAEGYTAPSLQGGMLDALSVETRLAKKDLINLIDAFNGAEGDNLGSIQELVQRMLPHCHPSDHSQTAA
ncbi:unnamed protein product [Symbiodinium natans]|uniref:Uncharacterized protein n=1 Tax=Symbiodinium natans TaxID=878477 RepID=A0A812N668_9DINO|nr:unnamed protein product [Symbiodinium natans]